jgi:hypothetical protein
MAEPKPKQPIDEVPAELRPLVDQLVALDAVNRELVVRAARKATRRDLRILPWSDLHEARGTVHLGGDAIADTDALYDE